jgi:hypothetical protein
MRFITPVLFSLAAAGAAASFAPALAAQAPAASAFVPAKTSDGYPNIEGVWRAWNLAKYDLEDHGSKPGIPAGRGFVVDPADGKIPYKPEMLARRQKNYQGTLTLDPLKNTDPLAKCYMPGVPRLNYLGWPFQIIQDKQDVNFTYEWSHKKRIVPIGDNSPLPDPEGGLNLRWNGMARGRYEGNSLVVTLGNFNAYTWFDMAGNFHSDALTVVERFTPIGPDTLQYEATMTDPNVFTRPWTIRMVLQRQKEIGLLDYECTAMLDDLGIHHTFPRDFDEQQ